MSTYEKAKRPEKKTDNSGGCSSFAVSELLLPQQSTPEYGRYAYNFSDLPANDPTAVTSERSTLIGQLGTSGSGEGLDSKTKNQMENDFGYNFGSVRVHTDNYATNLTSALNAKATCYGQDIYFGKNQYSPNTQKGTELLKHELTHYQQQTQTGTKLIQNAEDNNKSDIVSAIYEANKFSEDMLSIVVDIIVEDLYCKKSEEETKPVGEKTMRIFSELTKVDPYFRNAVAQNPSESINSKYSYVNLLLKKLSRTQFVDEAMARNMTVLDKLIEVVCTPGSYLDSEYFKGILKSAYYYTNYKFVPKRSSEDWVEQFADNLRVLFRLGKFSEISEELDILPNKQLKGAVSAEILMYLNDEELYDVYKREGTTLFDYNSEGSQLLARMSLIIHNGCVAKNYQKQLLRIDAAKARTRVFGDAKLVSSANKDQSQEYYDQHSIEFGNEMISITIDELINLFRTTAKYVENRLKKGVEVGKDAEDNFDRISKALDKLSAESGYRGAVATELMLKLGAGSVKFVEQTQSGSKLLTKLHNEIVDVYPTGEPLEQVFKILEVRKDSKKSKAKSGQNEDWKPGSDYSYSGIIGVRWKRHFHTGWTMGDVATCSYTRYEIARPYGRSLERVDYLTWSTAASIFKRITGKTLEEELDDEAPDMLGKQAEIVGASVTSAGLTTPRSSAGTVYYRVDSGIYGPISEGVYGLAPDTVIPEHMVDRIEYYRETRGVRTELPPGTIIPRNAPSVEYSKSVALSGFKRRAAVKQMLKRGIKIGGSAAVSMGTSIAWGFLTREYQSALEKLQFTDLVPKMRPTEYLKIEHYGYLLMPRFLEVVPSISHPAQGCDGEWSELY
ncbi:DUF4157 domain-containing protein [Candidatus Bathycorpusculum sp.]|uniref:eCIS core domain-containing protein n=1 Tax=Candidatus Bathycorpusculum sp. TaxID=2994959 RepID=UPI002816EFEF|nr:DUF4157 domain-containing protein [Candidatus Termitimicrobium sp.]